MASGQQLVAFLSSANYVPARIPGSPWIAAGRSCEVFSNVNVTQIEQTVMERSSRAPKFQLDSSIMNMKRTKLGRQLDRLA